MSATHAIPSTLSPAESSHERRGGDRRRRPTSVFSRYAWFGGRRRGDRRTHDSANTYVDLYEPWLAAVLVTIAVLCALDAVFTLLYIQKGGDEANPIMDALIRKGPQTFVLVKCAITNLGLLVLCVHKNFRWVRYVIATLLVLYSALFLYHLYLMQVVQ